MGVVMAEQRYSVLFIVATIFMDAVGFGIAMPVLPRLLMEIGHINLSGVASVAGHLSLLFAAAQFACAPLLANIGDAYGRRPVLLISMAVLAANYLVTALATTLTMLYAMRLINGACSGSYAAAQAALADVSKPEDRAKAYALVGAAFGIGFVVGPAIGGLLGEYGPRVPFFAAAGLALLNFLYGLFIFPETLARENRRPFDWRRANPLGAWDVARKLPGMVRLMIVLFLWSVANSVYPLTWSIYGIARFGWSNSTIGLSLAAVGVVMAATQMLLTGRLVKRLGERRAALTGMAWACASFAGFMFATRTWQAFALLVFSALQGLIQPSLMAMFSHRGTPETQGEVQGIASMALGLASIVAPLTMNPALAWFTSDAAPFRFDGAAFAVAVIMTVLAMLALGFVPKRGAAVTN